MKNEVIIIGGGVFGCSIAIELARKGKKIRLIEKNNDILLGATKHNHNRIHFGYHYPRSIETAKQSLLSLSSFLLEYADSVKGNFLNYYAVAKEFSMVSPEKYEDFCNELGVSYKPSLLTNQLINNELLSANYKVDEPIYDCDNLRNLIYDKLRSSNVQLELNTDIKDINVEGCDLIVNCSYSALNEVNRHFGEEEIVGKYQDVLIPVIKWNHEPIGLTVMDGPFCSIMPRGFNKSEFLVYHVVEGVLSAHETDFVPPKIDEVEVSKRIIEKSAIFYPFLKDVEIINFWRSKRFIPSNSSTDSRLSQIFVSKKSQNYISVFSGKVTTAVSIAKTISNYLETGKLRETYV